MRLQTEDSLSDPSTSRTLVHPNPLSPMHKAALSKSTNGNSHSPRATNGSSRAQGNGAKSSRVVDPEYRGHDREEVTRIMIQTLTEMGFHGSAGMLSRESGYDLESPTVAAFRSAVLEGGWAEAEELLFGHSASSELAHDGGNSRNGTSHDHNGLTLAEGADAKEMMFWLRQQKFLELLEQRDLGSALMVLRQELTPLHQDIRRLHTLSSLIMCQSADDLKEQSEWDGASGTSRHTLLAELSNCISPSVMISEYRLATLLDQAQQTQIANCLYHNTIVSPSLYSDHHCEQAELPLQEILSLDTHTDEVWFLEFSHDGSRLATSGKDRSVVIFEVPSFRILHRLRDHQDGVTYLAFSPDDTKLITCSQDHRARMWHVETGGLMRTIDYHSAPVTTCAWAPDGLSFLTGSHDLAASLCLWDLDGSRIHNLSGGFRVQDCAISPDGSRLVVVTTPTEKRIHVYNFLTREEEYNIPLKVDLTCVNVTKDSRYMLINRADNEIQLLDIATAEVVQRFVGQRQGNFVIRSTLGGAAENFVVSGSEDSKIYVWHEGSGTLVTKLDGHGFGCVNTVSWNPKDPGMFASGGDDHTVRIWGPQARLPRKQLEMWREEQR